MLAAVFGEPALPCSCFTGSHASPKREREESAPRHASPSGCAGGWGHDGEARWKRATVSILPEAGEYSDGPESNARQCSYRSFSQ